MSAPEFVVDEVTGIEITQGALRAEMVSVRAVMIRDSDGDDAAVHVTTSSIPCNGCMVDDTTVTVLAAGSARTLAAALIRAADLLAEAQAAIGT